MMKSLFLCPIFTHIPFPLDVLPIYKLFWKTTASKSETILSIVCFKGFAVGGGAAVASVVDAGADNDDNVVPYCLFRFSHGNRLSHLSSLSLQVRRSSSAWLLALKK